MPRTRLTKEQIAETRNALLDVAQRLYEASGIDGMSFRLIAAEYRCSATMPYLYFDSKADLVDGLRIRAYEWLQGILVEAASSASDPFEALRKLAVAYVHAGVGRPRMYELLFSQDGAMAETEPKLLEAKLAAIGVCQEVISQAATSTGVELIDDPETVAHQFWIAAHGLVSLERGGFLVVGRTLDQLLPTLFVSMVRGVTGTTSTRTFDDLKVPREITKLEPNSP
ncbi:MAG: TetR/AcrR family transcriptional regulator [Candidatus Hydrogenedentota bacterium]